MTQPQEILDRVTTPGGRELTLEHYEGTFQIYLDRLELMSSDVHGSEVAMAGLASDAVRHLDAPRVLIGGLGMGFTLRAALDSFPGGARFVVAEVFPEVVAWNRGPLAHLASSPLKDPRVDVLEAEVAEALAPGRFDAILLDVDNGPTAFTLESNAEHYSAPGIERLYRSLTAGGVLAVWSSEAVPAFERRLGNAGFDARPVEVPACGPDGGPLYTIYLACREG